MKIIYTGAFRFPDKDAASQRVLNNAKILRSLGHEVIFYGWEQKEREEDYIAEQRYFYQGFEYKSMNELDKEQKSLSSKIMGFLTKGQHTLKQIKKTIGNESPDLIIVYNSHYLFIRSMLKFTKASGLKLVVDCTEWYESSHLPGGKYGLPSIDNYLRMTCINKKVGNIIAISSYLEEYYKQSRANTVCLPPLIDLDEPKWQTDVLTKAFSDEVHLIYAGEPGNKDLLTGVIGALTKANQSSGRKIVFNILGSGKEQILKVLNIKNLPDNVNCLGRIKMEEVPKAYAKNHFSVLIREDKRYAHAGFSTKFVESLTCGIPVIANSTSDIPDYLKDGQNGYLLQDNTLDELVRIFERIKVLSDEEYEAMKVEAKKTSQRFFDYNNYKNNTKEFLNTI